LSMMSGTFCFAVPTILLKCWCLGLRIKQFSPTNEIQIHFFWLTNSSPENDYTINEKNKYEH
jgi:hypothetical protein